MLKLVLVAATTSLLRAWTTKPTLLTTTFRNHHHAQQQQHPKRHSFCTALSIATGSIVTVDCRLVPEGDYVPEPLIDGVVLHESDPPVRLTFVLDGGNYLPGLHNLIADNMNKVGDSVDQVSLDAGWGARNPDLVATVSMDVVSDDPTQIKPGVQLQLANGLVATVTDVTESNFTMDANPPLAGASYKASVTLIGAEEGPVMTEYAKGVDESSNYQVATFALGCFWGGELEYMREPGVVGTGVGYTQGTKDDPSYEEVCSGTTGHAEAIAVTYDQRVVSYERLVHLAMDRLGEYKYLLNQVGNDRGTQYRHGVYYHTAAQGEVAKKIVGQYGEDCVTECLPAAKWWPAEEVHQQYLLKGGQSARKGEKTAIRCYG